MFHETRFQFRRFADPIVTRLDLIKSMSSIDKANPKLGVKLSRCQFRLEN
jgi:hypothetical protein